MGFNHSGVTMSHKSVAKLYLLKVNNQQETWHFKLDKAGMKMLRLFNLASWGLCSSGI